MFKATVPSFRCFYFYKLNKTVRKTEWWDVGVVVWDEVQTCIEPSRCHCHSLSYSSKSRLVLPFLVLPFWYLLARVVPDKFQKSSKTIVCV